jgi:RNA polymerase sigma-70 factor (ECF subfamily)
MHRLAMTDQQVHRHGETATDELSLIRDAQRGSRPAFEALYRQHVGHIYALCLRLTGNSADAEESTQDAFVRAWQKLGSFRGSSAFGTWLYRIAVNESLTSQRRLARPQPYLYLIETISSAAAAKEVYLDELEKAIARLPAGARHVFVLVAVYGFSHRQVARMLSIAIGTSKAQFHRARKLLAERLQSLPIENQEKR